MAIKCIVDDKSLGNARKKVGTICRVYLRSKEPVSSLKEKMHQFLSNIPEQFELSDQDKIAQIVTMVRNAAIKYGVEAQDPDFFNANNIENIIIASKEGIQENNPQEVSTDNLTDTKQVRLRMDATREFLDNAYGLATEVLKYVQDTTNQNLFDCLFVNRGSLQQNSGIVSNTTELNNNIRQYQEHLLRNITSFLYDIVKSAPNLHSSQEIKNLLQNPHLYTQIEGKIQNTGILDKISDLMDRYLSSSNFTVDILRQNFNTMNNMQASQQEREQARKRLNAYNSRVILDHFDTYLSLLLGKSIQIKDFNQKTGEDKYQISGKTSNLITTWRTSDNIDVEDEADMVTKLAINTTPLYTWQQDVPLSGKFISFQDFEHIMAKIKDIPYNEKSWSILFNDDFISNQDSIWNSLSMETQNTIRGYSLRTLINLIRKNPRKYLHPIFELLSNNEFYDRYKVDIYNSFTNDELNKLYSITRGIFSGDNSIYELSKQTDSSNDYYAYITQTSDAIFNVQYLQYYMDQDRLIKVRTLIDQGINNVRRQIEQTINRKNSKKLIKNYDDYISYLNLKANPDQEFKYISYVIPNTDVAVTVTASSGNVTFVNSKTGTLISNFIELWNNDSIKKYIDSVLQIGISNTNLQNSLYEIEKSYSVICKNLLSFAARVTLNQYVSNKVLEGKSVKEILTKLPEIYGRNAPVYDYALDEIGKIHGNDITTLRNLSLAKANLDGLTSSSQVKDGLGNGQSLQTLSRLLGSLHSQFDLQERKSWSASKDFMLLNIPGLFKGVYTAKEFYGYDSKQKAVTQMGVSEMAYSSIVYDFIRGLSSSDTTDIVGGGNVLFLPSVNSDKPTIGRIRIDLNKEVLINGKQKQIKNLSSNELEQKISEEFGTFYTNIYQSIVEDWKKLDNYLKEQGINVNLADDYINGFQNFNKYFLTNINTLSKYGKNPVQFIKYFTLQYNKSHRLHPLELIDQVHFISSKGNLGVNHTLFSQIARFNPQFLQSINPNLLSKYPTSKQFWAIKKSEVLKNLLKANFVINTTDHSQLELKYIRENYPSWIDQSGNVILAKINRENITSSKDLISQGISDINQFIDNSVNSIILNPILEQFNYLDYLFTQEFMNCTVGSFIAHPPKGKITNVLEQEAAQFLAQHKRNVSFTASMHPFQLNLLNGIPENYNIAVIEDIKDYQGTVTGLINSIKPFDGATFVNPFVVILENNSLGGAKAGITKKQFVHFKNERTGTGGIIKTAGFGLTNDWIRNSPFLFRMMKKMTNNIWLNEDGSPALVDITKSFRNNKIVYKEWYYKNENKYYKINRIESLGNNSYRRYIQEVSIDGNPIGTEFTDEQLVNTNYGLWNLFGGMNSMEIENHRLKLSNTSMENVVIAMNNAASLDLQGNPILKSNTIETQNDIWQPLKNSDVHYVATAGAVKQGAANINSVKRYSDDIPFDTQRIHMYQSGIQLDKEHHADDSELSLMTQVISACAAKGYTIDAAIGLYDALRKATDIKMKDHLQAVKNLFENPSVKSNNDFQEILMKSIIDSLGKSSRNSGNFAEIIAKDLIKQAREGKAIKFSETLLPLSDNTIYAKVLSSINSYLTSTGIKIKIPGILSVLTPSFNIFKLYADRKYESFQNPEQDLQQIQSIQPDIYNSSNPFTSITDIEIGRTYRLYNGDQELTLDDNYNLVPISESNPNPPLIQTPKQYRILKQLVNNQEITRVVEDITVGRDLAGYNVRFISDTGEKFQLNDLDSINLLYDINDLSDKWNESNSAEERLSIISNLVEFFQSTFHQSIDITPESVDTYINLAQIRLHRMLQSDLENLSPSSQDTLNQYQQLLKSRQDTPQWYDRYTKWVNIKLQRGDGNVLYIHNQPIKVNSSNFDQVEKTVSSWFNLTTKVRINNNYVTVHKPSIRKFAYELIMPKTFATKFGLKEFDDLFTIKNDKDFFIKQYLRNQAVDVSPNQYTIALKQSSKSKQRGHYYLLTKEQARSSGLKKKTGILTSTTDDGTFRLDSDSNEMYQITDDTEIYEDNLGNEVIVTNNLDFYINNLQYDSIQLSNNLESTPEVVRNIVSLLKNSSNIAANRYYRYVSSNGLLVKNVLELNNELNSIDETNYTQLDPQHPIIVAGREKHTSFLRALDVVAARIPAQSMQSYMPMKIVAFDNPDINTAHVSTYQILLQGSDYDVDAVSLATYDVDESGRVPLWSPYSNLYNSELMDASLELPFPTGVKTSIPESDNINNPLRFLWKYKDLLNISESLEYNQNTKQYEPKANEIYVDISNDTVYKLVKLKEFLHDIQYLTKPRIDQLQIFAKQLMDQDIVSFRFRNPQQVLDIFTKLEKIADRHNLYLDNLSLKNITRVVNNRIFYGMYSTIIEPSNLIQAMTSVDGTTGPLKSVASTSQEGKEAKHRTPGDFTNKYYSIQENQVGKQGIGICAVGLKSFFGLTQYNNYILNYGSSEQQNKLLIGSKHNGYNIGGKTYKTLANIRSKDPNTITNEDVLDALSHTTNDNDAALVLSALLSLATDNAKELALSKLNAGTKTIGMYIYGISIGMDFKDIAKIMMSDVGLTISNMLNSNVFLGTNGYSRVAQVFDYFNVGPYEELNKFNIHRDLEGNTIESPLDLFKTQFYQEFQEFSTEDNKTVSISQALGNLARSNLNVQSKLSNLNKLRGRFRGNTQYQRELYNQIIDFAENYIVQLNTINLNKNIYQDFKTLSDGAEEMRVLGTILSLNQGIKTGTDEFITQINTIQRAIFNKTGDLEDMIDLVKFAFDEQYRNWCIEKYEKVKHSFNILDVVSNIPHFLGYVQTLAVAYRESLTSFKFRSTKNLGYGLTTKLKYKREDKISKGIQNYVGDYMRKQWMRSNNMSVIIPKGNKVFDSKGNVSELTEDTQIKLGTDWGDATFRVFMENEIIPNLKNGIIRTSTGIDFQAISSNMFIQNLSNDLLTNTVSRNPSIIYTLPINMLPRTDTERSVFNMYKAEFNKLAKYSYEYNTTSYDRYGNTITSTQRIPIVDLFTYYAMIADSWKLGEKSLVPILEDFQRTGIIQDFHNYVAQLDKSGKTLSLNNTDFDTILPYVAPFESPYTSKAKYIWYRNPLTRKYQLMQRKEKKTDDYEEDYVSQEMLEDLYGMDEFSQVGNRDLNTIQDYTFVAQEVDTNYFPKGSTESNTNSVKWNSQDQDGTEYKFSISYNIDTRQVQSISVNDAKIDLPELKEVPIIKQNSIAKVDTKLIECMIKNKNNPCQLV